MHARSCTYTERCCACRPIIRRSSWRMLPDLASMLHTTTTKVAGLAAGCTASRAGCMLWQVEVRGQAKSVLEVPQSLLRHARRAGAAQVEHLDSHGGLAEVHLKHIGVAAVAQAAHYCGPQAAPRDLHTTLSVNSHSNVSSAC